MGCILSLLILILGILYMIYSASKIVFLLLISIIVLAWVIAIIYLMFKDE